MFKQEKKPKASILSVVGAELKQWTVLSLFITKSVYAVFARVRAAKDYQIQSSSYAGHFKTEAFHYT